MESAAGVPSPLPTLLPRATPSPTYMEDMAAEQKPATYEHILNLSVDHCINDTIKFQCECEVVHFQRFGEALDNVQAFFNGKKYCYGELVQKKGLYRAE